MFGKKKKKIGLALGGGAARGWAHIGVIEALIERGIKVDYVSGTSMGSLVGAAYASGRLRELKSFAEGLKLKKLLSFLDIVFPRSGLIDGKKVEVLIKGVVDGRRIEDLPIPFRAVSADLMTGKEYVSSSGDIIGAIRGSISIPGVFTPLKNGDKVLVDGGLVNPLPVSVVKDMGADFVIAVDVNKDVTLEKVLRERAKASGEDKAEEEQGGANGEKTSMLKTINEKLSSINLSSLNPLKDSDPESSLPNIFDVITFSANITQVQITEDKLKVHPADMLIRPDVGHIRAMDFHRGIEAIGLGKDAANAMLDELTIKDGVIS